MERYHSLHLLFWTIRHPTRYLLQFLHLQSNPKTGPQKYITSLIYLWWTWAASNRRPHKLLQLSSTITIIFIASLVVFVKYYILLFATVWAIQFFRLPIVHCGNTKPHFTMLTSKMPDFFYNCFHLIFSQWSRFEIIS